VDPKGKIKKTEQLYKELKISVDHLNVCMRVIFRIMSEVLNIPDEQFGILFPLEAMKLMGGDSMDQAEEIFRDPKKRAILESILKHKLDDDMLLSLRTLLMQEFQAKKAIKEHPDADFYGATQGK